MKSKKITIFLTVFIMLLSSFVLFACKKKPNDTTTEKKYTVSLDRATSEVVEEQTLQLVATVSPSGGVLKWTSSDSAVADVSDGLVRAKKAGETIITVKCGSSSASCTITVTPMNTDMVILESADYSLKLGDSVGVKPVFTAYTLSANGEKKVIENAEIQYSMPVEKLAKLNDSGNIVPATTRNCGTTSVKAEYDGIVAYASVTVYKNFVSDTDGWNEMLSARKLGEYYLITDDIDFSGKEYKVYTSNSASSSDYFVATVHGNGHTIKNISLSAKNAASLSLFGFVKNAAISDLCFENVTFSGTSAKVCGLATGVAGIDTSFTNISLNESIESAASAYTLFGSVEGGTIKSVMVKAESGFSMSLCASSQSGSFDGVYVLCAQAIAQEIDGVSTFTAEIEMAFSINESKPFSKDSWTYFGGKELPQLIKK